MKRLIIYGSVYGSSEKYAAELSRRTGVPFVSYERAGSVDDYDMIVYIGSLYAGGVLGMKSTLGSVTGNRPEAVLIATVGLADTTDKANIDNIRAAMKRQLPKELFDRAKLFHLRGGVDYTRLNAKHKIMMRLLYQKVKNLPPDKKTAEAEAMIESYGKAVDFTDFDKLREIQSAMETQI